MLGYTAEQSCFSIRTIRVKIAKHFLFLCVFLCVCLRVHATAHISIPLITVEEALRTFHIISVDLENSKHAGKTGEALNTAQKANKNTGRHEIGTLPLFLRMCIMPVHDGVRYSYHNKHDCPLGLGSKQTDGTQCCCAIACCCCFYRYRCRGIHRHLRPASLKTVQMHFSQTSSKTNA